MGPHFEAFWGFLWEPLGNPLGTHGDPKGPTGRPKALPRGVSRGVQDQTPKRTSFWTPPGGAQVSSRPSESTVFKNSGGSLLGPILAPFGEPFGTQEGHWTLPGGPRRVKRGSQRGGHRIPPGSFIPHTSRVTPPLFLPSNVQDPPLWNPFGRPRLGFQIFSKIRKWRFRRGEVLVSIIP